MSETKEEILTDERELADAKPPTYWLIGGIIITILAAVWRFYDLTLKPFHHDEGVNGFFLTGLFRDGIYKYDPSNYHGPTLYYIALAFTKVFGLEDFAVRASVGVFGVLMVVMVLFLRRYIGEIGSLAAAFFLAVSPGMIFISRYFIHEIFFVFCSLGIVLGVLFFIEGRKPGVWATTAFVALLLVCFFPSVMNVGNLVEADNETLIWILRIGIFALEAFLVFLVTRAVLNWDAGRPIYLLLASASAALFFATKETAFITLGTTLIAVACVWAWEKVSSGVFGEARAESSEPVGLTWSRFAERYRQSNAIYLTIGVALVFAYVFVLFFSSFFTYWEGVGKAFEAYAFWTKTGTGDHTQNGILGYAKWLLRSEAPIAILSAIGIILAFLKRNGRFAMFVGLWAFGLFLAYTIIPYKTPWLALSFILPMCLAAGYGVNEIAASKDVAYRIFAALLFGFAVLVLSYQAYDLNFKRFDDESMPYVYAHSKRGYNNLLSEIERYARKSGKEREATIEIVSDEYWPMPWSLRNYNQAMFQGKMVEANSAEMIVGKKTPEAETELAERYGAHYKMAGEFPLRPGVDLLLLVRRDLAEPTAKEIGSK